MEATCPHCQARLNVPAPGAYACGNCGKRVDVAPEAGAAPPAFAPPAAPPPAAPPPSGTPEYLPPGVSGYAPSPGAPEYPPPAGAPPGGPGAAPPSIGAFGLEPPTPAPGSVARPDAFPSPPPMGIPGSAPPAAPPSWAAQGPPPGAIGTPGLPPTAPPPGGMIPPPFGGATIPGMAPPVPYGAPRPEYAVPPVINPAEQAACANHPGNAAAGVCERCGDFMCRLCTTTVEGRHYCPKCFDLLYNRGSLQFTQRQFTLPGNTFGLGLGALLSSCLCFLSIPLGIAGLWYGIRALKEYGERPDLPNRWMANTGLVLSVLGILEGVGTIVAIVMMAIQGSH